jgi:hypothetical protein
LIACFTPFKLVSYLVPTALVGWLMIRAPRLVPRTSLLAVILAATTLGVFYALISDEFLTFNYLLALVTYSSFLPILVVDGRVLASRRLLEKLLTAATFMLAVQGVIGIAQAIYGAIHTGSFANGNGDYVQGTINPTWLSKGGFDNPMFAANLALIIIASLSLPDHIAKSRRLHLVVGTVALVLASVVHVLMFAAASLLVALVITRARRLRAQPSRRLGWTVIIVLGLGAGVTYAALPEDVGNAVTIVSSAVDLDAGEVPRAIMLYRVLTELPETAPQQPALGLGPGQFSSRASLMASGLYLGGPESPRGLPFVSPQATRLATEYCGSLLFAFADQLDSLGSTHQPFFSFLSVYTELGFVGLLLLLWAVFAVIRRTLSSFRAGRTSRSSVVAFCSGTSLVLLLGLQENYWEVPQAILIGLLLLKVLYANIVYEQKVVA